MSQLQTVRHSCAHVLATALLRIWPDAQFAAGPPVENGFYYDVDLSHRISPEDFPRIEKEMRKVIGSNQPFEREEISREDAIRLGESGRLAALSERDCASTFKLDILARIPEEENISLYRNGDFVDLCAGPHVESTGKVPAFKLTHVASAYYQGDETKPQLQRIYGTAFPSQKEMDRYFELLEEAKKRDHRKLGRDLDLFLIDETVGQGLILWTPRGSIIRQELQNFISQQLQRQGYEQVFTPHIGKLGLYRTSGHFPYYSDSQFPPLVERETLACLADEGCTCAELGNKISTGAIEGFLLKPMNCPMHVKIYDSRPRSYRELPVRLAEFGTVYRWEQSGELNGMTRVRGFTQDDAHIFCTPDQMNAEVRGCLDLVAVVLKTFKMENYRVRIGLRDPDSSKYVGESENWVRAEEACREAAKTLGVDFTEERGEAAFYGPKIDFVVRDVLGRDWQLGTVQVDFNLPERFNLSYKGSDGQEHRPVMIHRAPFGSLERFTGVLIEHFAGDFPLWLAPEQVRVLPISEKVADYSSEVTTALKNAGIRVFEDTDADKLGAKIRLAQLAKVPYMLVLGANEATEQTVSVRSRRHGDLGAIPLSELLSRLKAEILQRVC